MIELTRRYAFPAAHVLRSETLGERENERIFGKCANPNGHGHNYGVEVTVTGRVDPTSGQILPPDELDRIFEDWSDTNFGPVPSDISDGFQTK